MDRRTFLGASGVAAGAAVAGCGGVPSRPTLGPLEAHVLLDRLERGLLAIRAVPPGGMTTSMPWLVRPDVGDDVLRHTFEAFVVFDVASSVPSGAAVPADLQARLDEEWPGVVRGTRRNHALLAGMPPAVRRQIDRRVRARPNVVADTTGWIDEHAGRLGVATENRLRLRSATGAITTRMRRQSMNAVIDDCLAKSQQIAARRGLSLASVRSDVTTAMIEGIWQEVEGVRSAGGSGLPQGAYVPPATGSDRLRPVYPHGRRWNESWDRPGDEEQHIGGIFVALTCPLAFLLIPGIILIIAGAVQNGEWNGESEAERRAREEDGG
jgi:hypothetical protein